MRDKRQKFIELAEKRVSRLIKEARLIGNLSNRSNYAYREEDVKRIFSAIDSEVRAAKRRFDGRGSSDEVTFKLRG